MIYLKSLQPLSFDRGPQLPYEAGVERLALHSRRRREHVDDGWHWTSPSNCCGGAAISIPDRACLNRRVVSSTSWVEASNRKLVASRRVLAPV